MGTWGPGIFSDDEAADARDDWRKAVIAGADLEAATNGIVRHVRDAEPGPDQDPYAANVWIALAAAQFETGRLLDRVRDRALGFLEHGGDLERWEGAGAARARVLGHWAAKLRGPQPPPKRMRPPRSFAVRFAPGDVIRLRDPGSGAEGLAHVTAVNEEGTIPQVELLAWAGGDLPDRDALATLPGVPEAREPLYMHRPKILTGRKADAFGPHLGEVIARAVVRPPLPKESRGTATTWPMLARSLDGPEYREGLRLALDPALLAERRRESHRRATVMKLGWFARMVERFEAGEAIAARDVAAWAETIGRHRDLLAADERAQFDGLVTRARNRGVEIP